MDGSKTALIMLEELLYVEGGAKPTPQELSESMKYIQIKAMDDVRFEMKRVANALEALVEQL